MGKDRSVLETLKNGRVIETQRTTEVELKQLKLKKENFQKSRLHPEIVNSEYSNMLGGVTYRYQFLYHAHKKKFNKSHVTNV